MDLLVAVDFSKSTEKIVIKAKDIARALSAKVWLLHVAEPDPEFVGLERGPRSVRDSLAQEFRNEHLQIQQVADRFRESGIEATALLVQGATSQAILEEASRLDADMIVVGSHGRGAMYQLLLGSVSEGVIQNADRPILVIPTHERE